MSEVCDASALWCYLQQQILACIWVLLYSADQQYERRFSKPGTGVLLNSLWCLGEALSHTNGVTSMKLYVCAHISLLYEFSVNIKCSLQLFQASFVLFISLPFLYHFLFPLSLGLLIFLSFQSTNFCWFFVFSVIVSLTFIVTFIIYFHLLILGLAALLFLRAWVASWLRRILSICFEIKINDVFITLKLYPCWVIQVIIILLLIYIFLFSYWYIVDYLFHILSVVIWSPSL